MIKYVGGFAEPTDFLVATEANMMWQLQTPVPAAPLPARCRGSPAPATSARTWPATRWRRSATACATGEPEIPWQPEFDRAKEVLERSLLNPPVAASRPSARGLTEGSR